MLSKKLLARAKPPSLAKKWGGAVPLLQAGQINLIEAAPFALLCLVGLYVAGRFFWSVQEEKALSRGEMLPAIADASQHDSQPPVLTRRKMRNSSLKIRYPS